jgi:hypothetical protein
MPARPGLQGTTSSNWSTARNSSPAQYLFRCEQRGGDLAALSTGLLLLHNPSVKKQGKFLSHPVRTRGTTHRQLLQLATLSDSKSVTNIEAAYSEADLPFSIAKEDF